MEVDRLLRNSIQYGQSLIAIYSLLPEKSQRQAVHEKYMRPLRDHLILVRDILVVLIGKLVAFDMAASGVDDREFLSTVVKVLKYYVAGSTRALQVNRANLDHTIGLLADDLIAPGFDYSTHPNTLPHVPEAMKRSTTRELYKRAAVRAFTYLEASGRSRLTIVVQKWLTILAKAKIKKQGVVESYHADEMNLDSPVARSQSSDDSILPGRVPGQF
jgi:hypothetical protein